MERRLAAILAADVVGYSRMIREDERATIAGLKSMWEATFGPLVSGRGGRVFKMMGDGALAEFASVVDAVEAAIAVQTAMAEAVAELSDTAIELRIGINLGDIVLDGDDVLGDGVNVAARLEQEAPRGGILISDTAHGEVRGKISADFEDAGEITLKNLDRPLRAWRWYGPTATGPKPTAAPREDERISVAVLPFDNMSSDMDEDFLADGLSEDLITALSRIRWFLVIARNSTFTYKGRAVDVKQVGRELGVRYVVEGSVRKSRNRIRVTVQLIDAVSGAHVWAERYDRELEDIFDLQDEITDTVVGRIEPELSAAERTRAEGRPTDSLSAWECYQRGIAAMWAYSPDELETGIRLLTRATEIDPRFAPAYGFLAYSYYESVVMGWSGDPDDYLRRGLEAGRQATLSDERDPIGWFGLGRVHMMLGNHAESILALERAISLNPSNAHARHGLGMILTLAGRLDEARASLKQVERLSPRDPILWATTVIHSLADVLAGDHEEALRWALATLQNPRSKGYWPHALHAAALVGTGDPAGAREAARLAVAELPGLTLGYLAEALPTARPDGLKPYLDALRTAGIPD